MGVETLLLIIKDRDRGKIFEAKILGLSAWNERGPFDILPEHSHFISLIQNQIKITHEDNRVEHMVIQNGVVKVLQNTVTIYLGIMK
jgi:F0F1-type ATP synthase epsilon subunit